MNSLEIVLWLVPLAFAFLCVHRLRRACDTLRRAKEVWKTYAISVETAYECDLEYDDARTRPQRAAALDQMGRAGIAAGIAAELLCHMGEYPDAYGSSPFLPDRASVRNS
jgi:hypothetical protein